MLQLTMAENHTAPLCGADKEVKMLERSIQSSRHCFIQNFRDTGKMSEAGYRVLVEWFEFLFILTPFVSLLLTPTGAQEMHIYICHMFVQFKFVYRVSQKNALLFSGAVILC